MVRVFSKAVAYNNLKQSRYRVISSITRFLVVLRVSYHKEVKLKNLEREGFRFNQNGTLCVEMRGVMHH